MTRRFRGYALIVTVERNSDDRLRDLGESVSADGDLIERILLDEDVCGYGSDRVTRLGGTSATGENILAALARCTKLLIPRTQFSFISQATATRVHATDPTGRHCFPGMPT